MASPLPGITLRSRPPEGTPLALILIPLQAARGVPAVLDVSARAVGATEDGRADKAEVLLHSNTRPGAGVTANHIDRARTAPAQEGGGHPAHSGSGHEQDSLLAGDIRNARERIILNINKRNHTELNVRVKRRAWNGWSRRPRIHIRERKIGSFVHVHSRRIRGGNLS